MGGGGLLDLVGAWAQSMRDMQHGVAEGPLNCLDQTVSTNCGFVSSNGLGAETNLVRPTERPHKNRCRV